MSKYDPPAKERSVMDNRESTGTGIFDPPHATRFPTIKSHMPQNSSRERRNIRLNLLSERKAESASNESVSFREL
jgi:hypothetical protein